MRDFPAGGETTGPAQADPSSDNKQRVKRLVEHCHAFRGGDLKSSLFQLVTTNLAFFALLAVMFAAFDRHVHWLWAVLTVPAGLLLVRIFTLQHDCGHGSFFRSPRANDITGRLLSVLTFTPYDLWKRTHNMHHAGSGSLDRRGSGSIDTLTVREYRALSPLRRLAYRVYRHPLMLLVLGPPVYVLIFQRFPPAESYPFVKDYHSLPSSEGWRSVMSLNVFIVAFYGTAAWLLGWQPVLAIGLSSIIVGYWMGQWLFFIQHQFEDTYWQKRGDWNFAEAALQGSSYYALPRVLQWFTGNIGFHHVHHLCASIPNYRLQACHDGSAELQDVTRITLRQSLKCAWLALWDEDRSKMIGFRDLKRA